MHYKGEVIFTLNIRQAADFIGKRFHEVGLTPAASAPNYKQHYTVQNITPETLVVEINGQIIASEALSMATTKTRFEWSSNAQDNNSAVNTVMIGEDQNLRKALRELNTQGGQHLVLLHPTHEKSFKRYQSYFARGLTKLVDESANARGGVIVVALTDISKVKQFSVKGSATVTDTILSNVVGILPGKKQAK